MPTPPAAGEGMPPHMGRTRPPAGTAIPARMIARRGPLAQPTCKIANFRAGKRLGSAPAGDETTTPPATLADHSRARFSMCQFDSDGRHALNPGSTCLRPPAAGEGMLPTDSRLRDHVRTSTGATWPRKRGHATHRNQVSSGRVLPAHTPVAILVKLRRQHPLDARLT